MAHTVKLERGEGLDKGERYIVVDGVRWGRTVISYHGMHGTRHKFEQIGSGHRVKVDDRDVWVDSAKRRRVWVDNHLVPDPDWKPTDDLVLAKAVDLVGQCLLRHPDNVREEIKRQNEAYQRKQEQQAAKEQREFEAKATEMLDRLRGLNETSQVKIMVEAMRWAQTR